jgi:outer membrane immunogenic protein
LISITWRIERDLFANLQPPGNGPNRVKWNCVRRLSLCHRFAYHRRRCCNPVVDTSGFLGGGQVGCNYQFATNWVIGIEGDGSAADIHGDVTPPPVTFVNPPGGPFPPGPVPITSSFHAQTDWLASVTGRLGYAAGPWLFYAKGGVAWAGDKYAADIPIFQEHLGASQTRTGWTVGGGVEWAFLTNWSAKLEYDFYDFGAHSVTLTGFFPGVGPSTFPSGPIAVPGVDIKQTISVVKFGINYRFASY